ncbi:Xaa-Pro peptidase family protein [Paenibacillus sp. MY03]|uniref:M24 family metallopeptidase n=1 Tax=Paenibacillus sp. MY03 TaxID=302980 RepID=UPI0015C62906|nr:Xaa-Pro peptidase family protein [Paenibacillus sp. MY03]
MQEEKQEAGGFKFISPSATHLARRRFPIDRYEQLQHKMIAAGLDAVICRLPENVLFLTGYWPVSGIGCVVCPQVGNPVLIATDLEEQYMIKNRIKDVRFVPYGTLSSGDIYEQTTVVLREIADEFDLIEKKIGYEASFETIAPPMNSAEPTIPAQRTAAMIKAVFQGPDLLDATGILNELRAIKSPYDITQLQIVHEIAESGLAVFVDMLKRGAREIDISSAVEAEIARYGFGYKGMQHVRAWAQLMTGKRSSQAYSPFPASSVKEVQQGDMAVLELAVVADGYWADLTRTRAVGSATNEQLNAYRAIMEAQGKIRPLLREGNTGAAVDAAGRKIIAGAGYASGFIHLTGHGLGYKYHEPVPMLHPESHDVLQAGMVTSVEPGIYRAGEWGIRVEENVVITKDEPLYLSAFLTDLI